jgi:translation initiation factor IF-2
MSNPDKRRAPESEPTSSARLPTAPRPPEQGPEGLPAAPAATVYLLESMAVRDVANSLRLKSFKVIADLMELKVFKSPDDTIDFETAARIAQKHGYRAQRPPPGVLVL